METAEQKRNEIEERYLSLLAHAQAIARRMEERLRNVLRAADTRQSAIQPAPDASTRA